MVRIDVKEGICLRSHEVIGGRGSTSSDAHGLWERKQGLYAIVVKRVDTVYSQTEVDEDEDGLGPRDLDVGRMRDVSSIVRLLRHGIDLALVDLPFRYDHDTELCGREPVRQVPANEKRTNIVKIGFSPGISQRDSLNSTCRCTRSEPFSDLLPKLLTLQSEAMHRERTKV